MATKQPRCRTAFEIEVQRQFRGALGPNRNFLDSCFEQLLTPSETVSLWSNRLR